MRTLASLAALVLLAACQAQQPTHGRLAVEAPGLHRDELQSAAANLLGIASVRLGADAFTQRSLVTLTPRPARTPSGVVATGTTIERPPQLRLLRYGARRCALRQVGGDSEVWLSRRLCASVVPASDG
ncbi:MAG: hypothetical protein AAF515_14475 [Pseudomonadota bacterium]